MLALSNVIFCYVWSGDHVIEVQDNKMYIDVSDSNPALRLTFQAYALNLVHEETIHTNDAPVNLFLSKEECVL